jgi:hypothetical protein
MSLILSAVHFGLVGVFFILMFTIGSVPGVMHPVLIPFSLYMLFSCITPITVIIYGVIGLKGGNRNPVTITCIVLAILYIIAFAAVIVVMWPRWMSV